MSEQHTTEPPIWRPSHPTAPLPAQPPPPVRGRPRRGRGIAAAVLAGALVGGAAGVGGAATWDFFDEEQTATVQSSGPGSSPVVDTPDTPAAEGSVESVAQTVLPSVVKIDVAGQQGAGSGSGVVISADGEILTNDHVVSLAEQGGDISVSFADGTKAPAEVVGTDPLLDLAVIKAQGVEDLTPATIGRSGDLKVGQQVVAIGSPFGLDATVTSGIVSALDRPVDVGQDASGNTAAYAAIQTDAAINPGNSGGPLVDMNGHVVGINASIQTTGSSSPFGESTGGSIGLGFAIPIDAAMPIADQLRAGDEPTHARLGITVSDVSSGDAEGAQIQEVGDGSAAADAGLKAGDVITRIDDRQVTGADALIATIRLYRPGDDVKVTYVRGGDTSTTDLTLGSDAESS